MNRTMALLFFFCFLFVGGLFSFFSFQNPYMQLCKEVEKRIYLNHEEIHPWITHCYQRASLVTAWTPRQLVINDFKKRAIPESLSHLDLQEPQEAASFWTGESYDHGFFWRYLDQYILITDVTPGSSSDQAGLKPLDLIESFEDHEIHPSYLNRNGHFTLWRGNERLKVSLQHKPYNRYQSPRAKKIKNSLVLKLNDFFNTQVVQQSFIKLSSMPVKDKVVLDLRENSGGDFALALQFVNLFICERQKIGEIRRPKYKNLDKKQFDLRWSQEEQIEALGSSSILEFITQDNPACIKNPIEILISEETASTAELVAEALRSFRKAKLIGQKTRGSLLVGVARGVEFLGPGYLLYVPEAAYYTSRGDLIENQGVSPDLEKHYRLADIKNGEDSYFKLGAKRPNRPSEAKMRSHSGV